MSHFVVLVIGDVDSQLAPFDESIQMDRYEKGLVSQEDKERFIETYTKPAPDRSYAPMTEEEATENAKLSFDELYEKHGDDWNSHDWEKNEDGEWAEFSTYNPKSKWDWYTIGGRWSGSYFKLKPGAVAIAKGSPGVFQNEVGDDVVRFGDVDWEGMKKEGEKEGKERWEKLEKAFGGTIPQPEVTWNELWENEKYKDWEIEKKREFYNSQPALKILKEVQTKEENKGLFGPWFDLDEFKCTKEEFIERSGKRNITTFAVVKNGEWYEKGEMGWFGVSINDKEQNDWYDEVTKLLSDVDKDEILSIVDCHI